MTGSGLEHTGQWLPRRPVTSESLLSRSAAGWMRTRPASSKLFHPAKSSCESPRRCRSPDQSLCAIIARLHFSTSFKGPGTRPIATPATPCFSPHTFPPPRGPPRQDPLPFSWVTQPIDALTTCKDSQAQLASSRWGRKISTRGKRR